MYLIGLNPREVEIQKSNFIIYFRLMVAYMREMIRHGTDKVARRVEVHELAPDTIFLLEEALQKSVDLLPKLDEGKELEVMREDVSTICNCEIHLGYLRSIGVNSIGDLTLVDPLRLQDTLRKAEEKAGVRQPHLFVCLKSRASAAGNKAQHPKGSGDRP